MPRFLRIGLALAAIAGCSLQPEQPPASGDNSRNALDWAGAYVGTLPCADCPGIRTRIELREDGTFSRTMTYLGENPRPFADTGTFTWNASGSSIALGLGDDGGPRYQVGESFLFALDRDGQRITGDRAALYRLAKIVADPRIENTRWELVELNGRPLAPSNERTAPFLELDGAESRVTGNASCNRFFGSYDLTANERLQFAPNMASTMMACPELEREREFLEMLGRVDSYGVADGTLSLLRARMAPLARFRRGDD